ncbi:MAG: peptidyl-tRNA hydrolase [Planctomycetota bacterium]|nr:MAG: peptidyl-tRNA hydrolase [Planctomycetota bacterium]
MSASPVRLVLGLGNPGPEYEGTRHNVGFDALDLLAGRLGRSFHNKPRALVCTGELGEQRYVLAKPTTFMNLSGRAARDLLAEQDGPTELLVLCDDFHLPLGRLRCRKQGSSGGQNGLASILDLVGDHPVPRLRMGIGEPGRMPAERFVLERFKRAEQPVAREMCERAAWLVEDWLRDGDFERLLREANTAPV